MNIKFQVSNKILVLSSQLTNKETTNIKQHLNMFLIFLQIEKKTFERYFYLCKTYVDRPDTILLCCEKKFVAIVIFSAKE